jgi:nuclear protein localization family protein 4
MHRIQVEPGESFLSFGQKIAEALKLADPSLLAMANDPNPAKAAPLSELADKTIQEANLK